MAFYRCLSCPLPRISDLTSVERQRNLVDTHRNRIWLWSCMSVFFLLGGVVQRKRFHCRVYFRHRHQKRKQNCRGHWREITSTIPDGKIRFQSHPFILLASHRTFKVMNNDLPAPRHFTNGAPLCQTIGFLRAARFQTTTNKPLKKTATQATRNPSIHKIGACGGQGVARPRR